MQRLLNNAENYVDEMLEGIYFAYPNQVTSVGNDLRCYVSKNVKPGKVGIVTGGGSGHLPLFLGYVGEGMLDGCCIGGVFQSPSADQILQTTAYVNQGAGVLYLFGNYSGDVMNFDMAAEILTLCRLRPGMTLLPRPKKTPKSAAELQVSYFFIKLLVLPQKRCCPWRKFIA